MTGSAKALPVCIAPPERAVAKIRVTLEEALVQEIELTKERLTVGRKPHNDIVIEHRAVSGEHATFTLLFDDVIVEDLGSTNGTFIDGRKIFREKLAPGGTVHIANYVLTYLSSPTQSTLPGRIEVTSGAHSGKKLVLTKPLTTIGKPGSAVMAVTYAAGTYIASNIDVENGPVINGQKLDKGPRRLADGDVIDLAGTRLTFLIS